MSPPFTLFLGLVVMSLQGILGSALPTDPSPWRAVGWAPVLLVPCIFGACVLPRVLPGRLGMVRTGGVLVPICYGVFAFGADLGELAGLHSNGSRLLELTILAGPLFASELALRLAEHVTIARSALGEVRRWYLPPAGLERIPMLAFLGTMLFGSAGLVDLLFQRRKLAAFFSETSLGMTLGAALLLVVLAITLPLMFRAFLPIRRLPQTPAAYVAREAASALGFPHSSLRLLDTGHREINAALVGPLPWPRYLVLSDGLLSLFLRDPLSLRGVIAHEVGHARAHHPAWLVVCVAVLPLLWMEPLVRLLPKGEWPVWLWVAAAATTSLAVVGLRVMAHRFEHEADQLSAEVLGGAEPCITALRRVGELFPGRSPKKSSLRHPSEAARIAVMLENERDPAMRERFWRRGRILRSVLVAGVLLSIGLAAHAHAKTWSLDRVRAAFAEGRFPAAERMLETVAMDQLTERERDDHANLVRLVSAARQVVPEGGPWSEIRSRLAAAGQARAEAILELGHGKSEALAAEVWLALALQVPGPNARVRSLHAFCVATTEGRESDARELWDHAQRLR